jgi:NAD(P)-dependent dehydrogenase (short-subunit alcohol dehydrogenase family)
VTERLQGKVALIMGGGSAVGRFAALAFAQEGAKVVVADVLAEGGEETARMIRDTGRQAIFVQADVSQPGGAAALVEKAVEAYGQLDCAFNGARLEGASDLTAREVADVMMCVCSMA